jgi:type I restriction enzyme, S subunit
LYYNIKNKKFSEFIISGAQGSANQASITLEHAFSYNIPVPDESGKEKAKLVFEKLSDFSRCNENEVLILHDFKDMLLSKMTKAETTA